MNIYEHVIPAASGTIAFIQRAPGEKHLEHPVVAWASVDGRRMEGLVHVNGTGKLTSVTELIRDNEDVFLQDPALEDN